VRALALAVLALLLAACAPMTARTGDDAAAAVDVEREMLVMLRAPAPHFRPDSQYSSGYADPRASARRTLAMRIAHRYGLELVDAWPMPALELYCFVLLAPSAESVAPLIDTIARDADVESVQRMQVFHTLAHDDPLYPLQPSASQWHLADLHRIATGRNVRVAQIDTAVAGEHPDLRGRVALEHDFTGVPMDPGVHGTAVAGIIAARADNGIGIAGIAPGAKLMALRACREGGDGTQAACTTFALAQALQFALENDAQIINLSLGGPRDRLLERLLDAALARNIVIVAAADESVAGGAFPASHPGVLAVAAHDARALPAGTVLAPGDDVPTTLPGDRWGFVTGSSFAAAHVSGAVALLIERSPALRASAIRRALQPSGGDDPGHAHTAMAVDMCAALSRAAHSCACECALAHGPAASRVE
jgi:hypothetical protein